jgi:hypothetical protein
VRKLALFCLPFVAVLGLAKERPAANLTITCVGDHCKAAPPVLVSWPSTITVKAEGKENWTCTIADTGIACDGARPVLSRGHYLTFKNGSQAVLVPFVVDAADDDGYLPILSATAAGLAFFIGLPVLFFALNAGRQRAELADAVARINQQIGTLENQLRTNMDGLRFSTPPAAPPEVASGVSQPSGYRQTDRPVERQPERQTQSGRFTEAPPERQTQSGRFTEAPPERPVERTPERPSDSLRPSREAEELKTSIGQFIRHLNGCFTALGGSVPTTLLPDVRELENLMLQLGTQVSPESGRAQFSARAKVLAKFALSAAEDDFKRKRKANASAGSSLQSMLQIGGLQLLAPRQYDPYNERLHEIAAVRSERTDDRNKRGSVARVERRGLLDANNEVVQKSIVVLYD